MTAMDFAVKRLALTKSGSASGQRMDTIVSRKSARVSNYVSIRARINAIDGEGQGHP